MFVGFMKKKFLENKFKNFGQDILELRLLALLFVLFFHLIENIFNTVK